MQTTNDGQTIGTYTDNFGRVYEVYAHLLIDWRGRWNVCESRIINGRRTRRGVCAIPGNCFETPEAARSAALGFIASK